MFALGTSTVLGADWRQFRGPDGLGVTAEKGLPLEWSATKNLIWKTKLPGRGASSPITVGNRVFVTCYSGYGFGLTKKSDGKKKGTDNKKGDDDTKAYDSMADLRRHVVCVNRDNGDIVWSKVFMPVLPEHEYYRNESDYHGYAGNTPVSDGERLYVFLGKSGVYCLDLDGKEQWHVTVGKNTNGWGSGASPVLYKNLVIVNASIESGSMVALDKLTGKEVWKAKELTPDKKSGKDVWKDKNISQAWNTPVLVPLANKDTELVVSTNSKVLAFNPDTGAELWRADGVKRYVCPSVIAHDGIVYVLGGGSTSMAVRAGGKGDVTNTHVVWRMEGFGSNVSSPIYHAGHIYWAGDGFVTCQEAATGKTMYRERLNPPLDRVWASPVLTGDGRLYYIGTGPHPGKGAGTYVVAAQPKFEQLAHNVFEGDTTRSAASIAVSDGQIFLRTDEYLYCIGKR
jgi:hypothetical protein